MRIRKEDKLLVAADKTTNFYRLDAHSYKQLVNTAITKSYKKAPNSTATKIISTEKKIAENINLDNRIDALTARHAFVTLKDHTPNFQNNPTCRLINPAKSEIGVISQKILQRINSTVAAATNLNQWKNTNSVISWFKSIPNKQLHSFITFDIIDFYPSISEELLAEALTFASQYAQITDEERSIIMQAKSSLLFTENDTWRKKSSKTLFDVTMGSYDGAETCELVGSYLLSKLTPLIGNSIGLYRDDGLAASNKTPREIENIKKTICKTFSDHNLKLTISANMKRVDYLDITLDLLSETYKPFKKPGNVIQYVNRNSNHPPSIIRSIPEAINRRLSNISSDRQSFESAIPPYQEALKNSGHEFKLHYNPQPPKPKCRRNRNTIWFNPPYNANVSTNIGHKFLKIIEECFPKNHPLKKICNRNNLKLSYSCMPNVASIITSHNKHLLAKENQTNTPTDKDCNCRKKEACPLAGKCQSQGVVYQATVTREDNQEQQTYIGITEGTFKTRFNNHTSSFRKSKNRNSTALSKYVWTLKDSNVNFNIAWKIIRRCKAYTSITKKCNLCLHEKFIIIYYPHLGTLNSRNELFSSCKHRKKHLLSNH